MTSCASALRVPSCLFACPPVLQDVVDLSQYAPMSHDQIEKEVSSKKKQIREKWVD